MRKILIATPTMRGLPARYVSTLVRVLTAGIPDCIFDMAFLSDAPIGLGRCQLAAHARRNKFDEILWWDDDILPTLEQVTRLCSFTLPFVTMPYTRRSIPSVFHIQFSEGSVIGVSGLRRADLASIGFCKMSVALLDKIAAAHPELACTLHENGNEAQHVVNFFPMQIVGPNTAEEKLRQILAFVDNQWTYCADPLESLRHVEILIKDSSYNDYSGNRLVGEDYGFCLLARSVGCELMVDTTTIVAHTGSVDFPVTSEALQTELNAVWRQNSK